MFRVQASSQRYHLLLMLILTLLSFGALASGQTSELGNVTSTSVPNPEPITNPTAVTSASVEPAEIEAASVSPKPSILTTILQPRKPTVLHEVPLEFRRGRSRSHESRRRGSPLRNRNPGQTLRRLISAGKRMIARSLSLFGGGDAFEDGSYERVPTNLESSSSMDQLRDNGHDSGSLNQRLTDIDPVQLLMNGFNNKQNKMRRFRELKDEYRKKELERSVAFFDDMSGDVFTRNVRNLLWKIVNKYEKGTDMIELWANYRRARLQTFLEIPIVSNLLNGRHTSNNSSSSSSSELNSQEVDSFDTPSSPTSVDLEPSSQEDVIEPERQQRLLDFNPVSQFSRKFMRLLNLSF